MLIWMIYRLRFASLAFPFHVIGIIETRENYSTGFKMNNNLNFFTLFSQPSRSIAGGVAIYASKSSNALKRTDLSKTDDEFQTSIYSTANSYN